MSDENNKKIKIKKRQKEYIYYAIEIRMIWIINGTPDKKTTLIKSCVSYLRPPSEEQ